MKLLAILVGAKSAPACLDAAALAAKSISGASVEALHVMVDPNKIITASDEIAFQQLREREEGTAQQRADAAHAAFLAWSTSASETPSVQWKVVAGQEEEVVCREAAAADVLLLVLAREHNIDSGDAFHAAVFRSGKPVLVVPPDWRSGTRTHFAHIAVGLSDSQDARHAIEGAGPWLRSAERITAIRIGKESDAALGLTRLLSEAGLAPELHVVGPKGSDLGAQIVDEAQAVGADLLVAGAYRRPQLLEWLVGGTTRHLLAAADLPLFLAH